MTLQYEVRTAHTGVTVVGGGLTTMYFNAAGRDPQELVDAVRTFWTATIAQRVVGTQSTPLGFVRTIENTTGEVTAVTAVNPGAGINGTAGGAPLPPATQGLLRLRTGVIVRNRVLQGKIFLPGVPVSFSSDGIPSTAYRTAYDTAAGGLISNALTIYSRPRGGLPGSGGAVGSASTWSKFAVLRSRRD